MGNFAANGGRLYFTPDGARRRRLCIVTYSLMGGGIHVDRSSHARIRQLLRCLREHRRQLHRCSADQTGMNNNISEEPQFCDAASGDLALYNTSPCAEEYSPCGQLIGANEVDCLSVTEPSSWGKIKSDYR